MKRPRGIQQSPRKSLRLTDNLRRKIARLIWSDPPPPLHHSRDDSRRIVELRDPSTEALLDRFRFSRHPVKFPGKYELYEEPVHELEGDYGEFELLPHYLQWESPVSPEPERKIDPLRLSSGLEASIKVPWSEYAPNPVLFSAFQSPFTYGAQAVESTASRHEFMDDTSVHDPARDQGERSNAKLPDLSLIQSVPQASAFAVQSTSSVDWGLSDNKQATRLGSLPKLRLFTDSTISGHRPMSNLETVVADFIGGQKVPSKIDLSTTSQSGIGPWGFDVAPQVPQIPVELDASTRPKGSGISKSISKPSLIAKADVARSASLPTTFQLSSTAVVDTHAPERSLSTLPMRFQLDRNFQTLDHEIAALNGVSLYYSSRSRVVVMEQDGTGRVQLTQSQRIKRCSSFGAIRMKSARLLSLKRFHTIKDIRTLVSELPFDGLLRSSSLKSPSYYQSIQLLQAAKSSIRKMAGAKTRFHWGKVSLTARASLMRRAYPEIHCGYCKRVFEGSDRKRKLARHRRKVHACAIPSSTGAQKYLNKPS